MQTIGERLEEARKKKGISIREAAEATKIRGDYLQKFESNHFDIGLTEIYTRGFLRTYANFLKVPADRILNDYAALGRGEVRPRQPNREVYGRMDITVATSGETGDRAAAPEETPPAPEPSPANRGPQRSRPASSLPTGLDPALVFKYVKWGGIAVVALVAIIVIWSLISGGKSSNNAPSPAASTPRGPTIGLVASAAVKVSVHRANPDGTDGDLLFEGIVYPGETRVVPRPGAIFINANPAEHLEVEINGRRHSLGLGSGEKRGELPAPR